MKTVKRSDGYWIVDVPDGVLEMGPYKTRKEADEDRKGVERTLANEHKPGYITADKRRFPKSRLAG